jgi:hypothetical protein
MTHTIGSDSKIESYLARVRAALRGMPEREMDDTLRELRSHVVDLAGEGETSVDAALQSLGDPVDLAKTYRSNNDLARAECSGSPLAILQGLRHASRSAIGRVTVGTCYFLGYFNVVTLWAAAIEKLLEPSRTGLWHTPGDLWSFKLVTFGAAPAGANEVLGWWLVPAAVAAGWVLRYGVDQTALWWIRRYRKSQSA